MLTRAFSILLIVWTGFVLVSNVPRMQRGSILYSKILKGYESDTWREHYQHPKAPAYITEFKASISSLVEVLKKARKVHSAISIPSPYVFFILHAQGVDLTEAPKDDTMFVRPERLLRLKTGRAKIFYPAEIAPGKAVHLKKVSKGRFEVWVER